MQAPWEVPKNNSNSMKYIVAAMVGLIGIAVVAVIVLSTINDDDAADNDDRSAENEATACQYDDASCFPTWVGIEQGVSASGGIPTLGSPDAPIYIGEFSDFACPHCATFEPTMQNIVTDYVRDGDVQLHYFPLTFVAGRNSEIAAEAAVCLTDQGAFWQFSQVLFEIQVTQSPSQFTTDNLVRRADQMGLDGAAMRDCMNSDRPASVLRAAQSLQAQLNVFSTPTVVYSTDGGATWTVLDNSSATNIRAVIEGAVH